MYTKEEKQKYLKDYYQKNKEKMKESARNNYEKNKQPYLERSEKHRVKHSVEYRAYLKQYRAKKKKPLTQEEVEEKARRKLNAKIKRNLSRRVLLALNGRWKSSNTSKLIGCTIEEFRTHLEAKFTEGMNWDNYGLKGWHIDHIIPCYYFDLAHEKEQQKCFHYTNCQPLWAIDNLRKNKKLEYKH